MSQAAVTKILFVCMGNICRSPAAEGVMRHLLAEAGLDGVIQVDSAGTGGWHAGGRADGRMRKAASRRGYDLTSIARQVTTEDLAEFGLVLVMDAQNRCDLRAFDPKGLHDGKVRSFCDFCTDYPDQEVPDPYYGGDAGFEHVLDLLEDGCANLIQRLRPPAP
ncbi:MAG: low molecular weight protein-tyrosine-phosphatase [Prosthecobacter sp.]|nr:low molecular weight protein-tyrosine-phosphatase [Prosthecobacter sp.]